MKKILTLITVFLLVFTLVSCKKEKEEIPDEVESSIVISKLMIDYNLSAIELYNPSDSKIDLKYHYINIFGASSNSISTRISLEGEVSPKGFFLIVNEDNSENKALDLADFKYKGETLKGREAIELRAGKKIIDIIGSVGAGYDYANVLMGTTYMRKEDRLVQRDKFIFSDYLEFGPGRYDLLGKIDTGIIEEDYIYGPLLTNEQRNLPFVGSGDLGGGGTLKVAVVSLNDGDTTLFNFEKYNNLTTAESSLLNKGKQYSSSRMSTRYYYIDTPETQQTRQEEFGYAASKFTNDLLTEAEELGLNIEVLGPLGLSLDGSFDRLFGHVYVDGVSLSYLLLRHGLADNSVESMSFEADVYYKGMTAEAWMRQAVYYAKEKKIGIHGGFDPSFIGNDSSVNTGFTYYFDKWFDRGNKVAVVRNESELNSAIQSSSVTRIEIASSFEIKNTIDIIGKEDLRIVGFMNELTGDKNKTLFNIENSDVNIQTIILSNTKTPIVSKNSTVEIDGYFELKDNTNGLHNLENVNFTVGKNYILRPVNNVSNQNFITFDYEDDALITRNRLYPKITLTRDFSNGKTTYKLG